MLAPAAARPPGSPLPRLDFAAAGALTHPAVGLTGGFDGLRFQDISAERLDIDARVPDVLRPLDTDASLRAHRLVFLERRFEQVKAGVTTHGRALIAELTAQGMGDVVARVTGTADRDSRGLAVEDVFLASSTGEWRLEAPTHLAWSPDWGLEPLRLRSGAQRLTLEGRSRGQRLEASLAAEGVRLEAVPRVLLPEAWGLAGSCRAGSARRPTDRRGRERGPPSRSRSGSSFWSWRGTDHASPTPVDFGRKDRVRCRAS